MPKKYPSSDTRDKEHLRTLGTGICHTSEHQAIGQGTETLYKYTSVS